MASLGERAGSGISALREEHATVDHVIRTFGYYGSRNGNAQAGAVTFFAFLSFFPILMLAFFVVGWVSNVFPDLRGQVMHTLQEALPGVVGTEKGEIPLTTFEEYAGTVGRIGLVGVLYSGLGWVSGMRGALEVMFRLSPQEEPNFIRGKWRDLRTLVVLGVVLLVSVSLSGAVSWLSQVVLGWIGLADSWLATGVVTTLTHGLAILVTALLFMAMFRLLAKPRVAARALWQGAWMGAVAFEVLKAVARLLIGLTEEQPAFQAFGVALILVVWINYFSRLVMLSAAWAYTAPVAHELRTLERAPLVSAEEREALEPAPAAVVAEGPPRKPRDDGSVRAGGGAGGALSSAKARAVAALTRLGRRT